MYQRLLSRGLFTVTKNLKKMELSGRNGLNTYSTNTIFDLDANRIVWIDMEMTGLNVESDKIMEIACLITDSELNIIAESPEIIINQTEKTLLNMDEWCQNQHRKTGLTEACLLSNTTLEQAEDSILKFLQEHVPPKISALAGNSVYMDRFFLMKYMAKVNDYLHYRIIDVSTIKELCRRWNPRVYKDLPKKQFNHRALQDIKESVQELKFYKEFFFKSSTL